MVFIFVSSKPVCNMSQFRHLGSVPGMGKLSLCFLDTRESRDTKEFFARLHKQGDMNKSIALPGELRGVLGVENHDKIGVTKLKDSIALWKLAPNS
jgi:hypothetical protein